MNTSNEITIKGDYTRIFDLAARVEDWGDILPHYRYVKLLKTKGNRKWVRMSARRDFIPVTWTAIQTTERGTEDQPGRITFHHIKGLVRGMDVEWSFYPRPTKGDTLVRISHQLPNPPFPVKILGAKLTDIIVGRAFIGYIANKTLNHIKQLTETPQTDEARKLTTDS